MGYVYHMQQERRLFQLFQGGPERGHQLGGELLNETDRVRKEGQGTRG